MQNIHSSSRSTLIPRILLTDRGFGCFYNCLIIGTAGWLMELFIYYLEFDRLYDCGFLIMPWCPIYANGILVILLMQKLLVERVRFTQKLTLPSNKTVLRFAPLALLSAVCATVIELFSGILFYQMNIKLWNYSAWPLSNRYVSLPASLFWGIGGALFLLYVYPLIEKKATGFSPAARKKLIVAFFLLVLLDYIVSFLIIANRGYYKPLY